MSCDLLCVDELNARFADADARAILAAALKDLFRGRVAVVSSFGAESAVLLDLVATVAADTPVLFLETGKHFPETLEYRDRLVERLGLTDVRSIRPDAGRLERLDPDGTLHESDPDLCCWIRKVEPLSEALEGFDAWVTGRKRYQGGARSTLVPFEWDEGRIKVNPLVDWTPKNIIEHMRARRLPAHPLVARGYASIGCAPCTQPVGAGEDLRAGRWRGLAKTECGIHLAGAVSAPQR